MSFRVYSTLSARVRAFKANVLAADRRRNPWIRFACRLIGIALLAGLLVFGMLLYSALMVIYSIQRLLNGNSPIPSSQSQRQVMDGQYRVVDPKSEPPVTRKAF